MRVVQAEDLALLLPRVIANVVSLAAVLAALVAIGPTSCSSSVPAMPGVPDIVDFNFHVKPILSDRCFKCHGPDDGPRKGGLRLDRHDGALAELPSGRRAIVPGKPGRSELVSRITSTDPAVMMPDPSSRLTLDEREKATLIRWIEQGAEWKPHWSFIPPSRPAAPEVKASGWPRNDIDRFVLATLEAKGLAPSRVAPRETLLRRVSFDLTGLPPTLQEIDAFVADSSPDAYEKVVDRLLESEAYGERMAAEWLDVARYADSHGYQDDGMRQMWPWRDWVIGAFNRNLPFDDFITWQLAGDLLPEPTQEQLIATGFNRNHMQSQEGGVVPEEYRTEYVVDRVNTLGRAFLGVTVECARCHDHKYDAVKQEEFYRLFAFFNSVNEVGQIPYSGVPSPTVVVVDAEAEVKLTEIGDRIESLEAELAVENPMFDPGFEGWLARPLPDRAGTAAPPGLIVHLPLEPGVPGSEMTKGNPEKGIAPKKKKTLKFANRADPKNGAELGGDEDRVPETVPGRIGNGQRLAGDSHITLGEGVAFFDRNEPFSLALWFRVDKEGTAGPLVTRSGGPFDGNRGYGVLLEKNGLLTASLHHVAPDSSLEIETVEPLVAGEWQHLGLTYDGSSRAGGLRIFLDGQLAETRIVTDNLKRSILHDQAGKNWIKPAGLRLGHRHEETLQDVSVDELRAYDRQLTVFEMAALAGTGETMAHVRGLATGGRTPAQQAALREHYVLRHASGLEGQRAALTRARGEQNQILTALPEVMSMRERSRPRPTFVLARGVYDAPTYEVGPGTPEALGAFPSNLPRNRLGLAQWLLDPEHPLTARVLVNRYWALVFGRGLVATLADFGSQGHLPSHPELLDRLAGTFVASGWDLKALLREMVLSATYRQSSVADGERLARDPENQWLARGPSHRLSAEQIRDGALAASGLLVRRIGGPSVYPYQPPGLWAELATRNATKYEPGKGQDLYRRSLYTVWKRSTPPPSAISFDAADRLSCAVTRQRTSTPMQSLVLLNDPQYLEASRVLAERMILEGGPSVPERITHGFRLLTSRAPDEKELGFLETLLAEGLAAFQSDRQAALSLLEVGERAPDPSLGEAETAAYAVLASTVMNYDEAVFKR